MFASQQQTNYAGYPHILINQCEEITKSEDNFSWAGDMSDHRGHLTKVRYVFW